MSYFKKDGRSDPALFDQREELLRLLLEEAAEDASADLIVPLQEEKEAYPLSFAQQRLWFLTQLAPDSPLYNIFLALHIEGPLDIAVLQKSFNEIVRRHKSLRATFMVVDGEPMQRIIPRLVAPFPLVDLKHLSDEQQEAEVLRLATDESQRPFDLRRGPLLRIMLLQLSPVAHVLLVTMHHIVSDAWSMSILRQELGALYEAFLKGEPSPLREVPIQYIDFALWQRRWLQGDVLQGQVSYWKQQLDEAPPMLVLPSSRPRPPIQTFVGATYPFVLPEQLSKSLGALSRREGATLFMTLLAAFQVLLFRYTGQEDVVVGSPIANRNSVETEQLIGFFVNTLVLRTLLTGNPTFRKVLQRVRKTALEAYAHQDLPFERLVEELQPQRDLSRNPLFQVAFVLQNASSTEIKLANLRVRPLEIGRGVSVVDMSLITMETSLGIEGAIEYNTDLFDADMIARLHSHWQTLLEGIVANPDERITALPLLTAAESDQLLIEWNETRTDYYRGGGVHELFEAQVERAADAIAIVFEGSCLTYGELNRRAEQLAGYLQAQGIKPEMLVGVYMEPCLELIVGLLAILKAGAAYVPLDPYYPRDRLAFIVAETQVPLLLTQERLAATLPSGQPHVVYLDREWERISCSPERVCSVAPINRAYVIYTSGSTGAPKGVEIQHEGLCSFVAEMVRAFDVGPGNRVAQMIALGFDASLWEIFMALAGGATLCLRRSEPLPSVLHLVKYLREEQITLAIIVPSILSLLSEKELPDLRILISGAEPIPADLVRRWAPRRRFFNTYGPTETTISVSRMECAANAQQEPPIGRPIANVQMYVLDTFLQPVPVGVPGELYIGGVCLARGYFQRPDLTADAFIPHPFSSQPGARLYKTGDVVRYRSDGNIEFLRRSDNQVKIRGFRVELGEIEAILRLHPAVRECVVLMRDDLSPGDKSLVAYVVPSCHSETTSSLVEELRNLLSEKLPHYMLPSTFLLLPALPLSPNGKIDRQALPRPERGEQKRAFVPPQTDQERLIADIWRTVLSVESIGSQDNFFDLGGHSLLLIQVHSKLQQKLNRDLPMIALFKYPTISSLAGYLSSDDSEPSSSQQQLARAETRTESLRRQRQLRQAIHSARRNGRER